MDFENLKEGLRRLRRIFQPTEGVAYVPREIPNSKISNMGKIAKSAVSKTASGSVVLSRGAYCTQENIDERVNRLMSVEI